MPRIHKLPLHEIQKIAAGEVVERPANVVKELLENALDAGATNITLQVRNGGKDLISISDDGCGMSAQDAHMSIEHHATSKLTSVHDLHALTTFGFRGEALSSICAVSKTTLTTKESSDLEGICLSIEGGTITQETPAARTTGTTIEVHDLFYNVPARKKFLKTRETEWHQIQQLVQAYSLIYKTISFKVIHDDHVVFNCPATDTLATRISQLWDHNFAQNMLAVEYTDQRNDIALNGAISHHQYSRYDRNALFFFVNNRWIKNYTLSKALLKGYMNVLPQGRFPAGIIAITIDPALVDINIHPRKEEVQFLHPRIIEQLIQTTVKKRLEKNLSAHLKKTVTFSAQELETKTFTPTLNNDPFVPLPNKVPSFDWAPEQRSDVPVEPSKPFIVSPLPDIKKLSTSPVVLPTNTTPQSTVETNAQLFTQLPTAQETPYTIIGQFNQTYILLDHPEGLTIIDQHAAHERVLYEQFAQRFKHVPSINLLFPALIHLTQQELQTIEPYLTAFTDNGIVIESFGVNQLVVQAVPVHLKDHALDDLVKQIIAWIDENQALDHTQFLKALNEKLQAQMACKAAVKAGDILTHVQMQKLIDDLYATNNRLTCPHGRPTSWLINTLDVEKKFKRKL